MKLTHFISTSSTFVQELSMKKKCAISVTKLAFKHPRKHPRLLHVLHTIIRENANPITEHNIDNM